MELIIFRICVHIDIYDRTVGRIITSSANIKFNFAESTDTRVY